MLPSLRAGAEVLAMGAGTELGAGAGAGARRVMAAAGVAFDCRRDVADGGADDGGSMTDSLASASVPHSRSIGRLLERSAAAPAYSMAVSSTRLWGRSLPSASGARSPRASLISGSAGGGGGTT